MGDNIFATVNDAPVLRREEWFPFLCDNANNAPGDDILSLNIRRQVSVAAMVFVVRRTGAPSGPRTNAPFANEGHAAGGRRTLAQKMRDLFPNGPN